MQNTGLKMRRRRRTTSSIEITRLPPNAVMRSALPPSRHARQRSVPRPSLPPPPPPLEIVHALVLTKRNEARSTQLGLQHTAQRVCSRDGHIVRLDCALTHRILQCSRRQQGLRWAPPSKANPYVYVCTSRLAARIVTVYCKLVILYTASLAL